MSPTLIAVILVACVALIGAVYAVYKRGLVSAKTDEQTPAGSAKP